MKLQWAVRNNKLQLSIQYFKQSETSGGLTGCSSNYMFKLDKGFDHAYNQCVQAAKAEFHLPGLK